MGEKQETCAISDGHIAPCWVLDEVLQPSDCRGTKYQGVTLVSLVNMKTMAFSREIVVLKSGKHGKKGIRLVCCPFCGGNLLAGPAAAPSSHQKD